MSKCYKTLPMQQMLQPWWMVGDGGNACQAAEMRPEDRVGFMDGMLYTAGLDGIGTLIHNNHKDFSHFIVQPW